MVEKGGASVLGGWQCKPEESGAVHLSAAMALTRTDSSAGGQSDSLSCFFGYCRLSPEGFVDCREGNVVRWDSCVKTRVALKQEVWEGGISRSSVCLHRC